MLPRISDTRQTDGQGIIPEGYKTYKIQILARLHLLVKRVLTRIQLPHKTDSGLNHLKSEY